MAKLDFAAAATNTQNRLSKIDIFKAVLAISALLLTVKISWLLLSGPEPLNHMNSSRMHYETLPDYFLQSTPSTDASTLDYQSKNFGLISRDYPDETAADKFLPQWQRLSNHLLRRANLSQAQESGTKYRVLYLGRHGEGYHNVAEAKYGTRAWDDYWSKLEGDGELYWSDAELTSLGEEQAEANSAWLHRQFSDAKVGMPVPGVWWTSPLMRCLRTAQLTWGGVEGFESAVTVKEGLREVMGVHTCDRRSSRSVIEQAVPRWRIEEGFEGDDELWSAEHRETWGEIDGRLRIVLDELFEGDGEVDEKGLFVSFTSHSGAIASLLRVVGHPEFKLPTGGMMPVVVEATREEA